METDCARESTTRRRQLSPTPRSACHSPAHHCGGRVSPPNPHPPTPPLAVWSPPNWTFSSEVLRTNFPLHFRAWLVESYRRTSPKHKGPAGSWQAPAAARRPRSAASPGFSPQPGGSAQPMLLPPPPLGAACAGGTASPVCHLSTTTITLGALGFACGRWPFSGVRLARWRCACMAGPSVRSLPDTQCSAPGACPIHFPSQLRQKWLASDSQTQNTPRSAVIRVIISDDYPVWKEAGRVVGPHCIVRVPTILRVHIRLPASSVMLPDFCSAFMETPLFDLSGVFHG